MNNVWYWNMTATKAVVGRLCAQASGEFSLLYRAPLCKKGIYVPVGMTSTVRGRGHVVYTPMETARDRMRAEMEDYEKAGDLPPVPKKYYH